MDQRILISSGRVVTPHVIFDPGSILIQGTRIHKVGPDSILRGQQAHTVIDASGCTVVPGFIDLHVHGGGGADAMDASPEAIAQMGEFHVKHGTTGFVPTVMSSPKEEMLAATRAIARASWTSWENSAQVLGVNLEGPFLSLERKGAQPPEGIQAPDRGTLQSLLEAGQGLVRICSVAPEADGVLDLISLLASLNVVVAAGHSDATFVQMEAGVSRGLSHVTHTFNAMRGLHHREPGVVGAALVMDGLTCEVVADGLHVHPAMVSLLARVKGNMRTILITDAMRAAGLPDGEYDLAGQHVTVADGQARLDSGVLAGSTLTMGQAFRNMVNLVGVSVQDAACMASTAPAAVIGLSSRKGRLEAGMDGDVVVLDSELEVRNVIVAGRVVYSRE
ncbi:MAG: N-acetylglucosamine-6-phosphate deacetylase [Firmicutes bacterium]|nr:N-acetylglucosamine-6-phosphate deacetylase [Bacillota bacterium]